IGKAQSESAKERMLVEVVLEALAPQEDRLGIHGNSFDLQLVCWRKLGRAWRKISRGPGRRRRSGSTSARQLKLGSRSKRCSADDRGQAHNAIERNGEVYVLAGRKGADDNRQGCASVATRTPPLEPGESGAVDCRT